MNVSKRVVIAASALLGVGTIAWAADSAAPATAPAAHHWHGGHPGMMQGPLHHVLKELNLTPEQKQQVHSILESARPAPGTAMPDFTVLANPGDPNFAAAVAQAKVQAAQHVQKMADVSQQIYAILTPDQKAKLPQVLADMKAKFEQRRQEWQEKKSAS
jgi:Spy/CpxP family protein refolding chaperone